MPRLNSPTFHAPSRAILALSPQNCDRSIDEIIKIKFDQLARKTLDEFRDPAVHVFSVIDDILLEPTSFIDHGYGVATIVPAHAKYREARRHHHSSHTNNNITKSTSMTVSTLTTGSTTPVSVVATSAIPVSTTTVNVNHPTSPVAVAAVVDSSSNGSANVAPKRTTTPATTLKRQKSLIQQQIDSLTSQIQQQILPPQPTPSPLPQSFFVSSSHQQQQQQNQLHTSHIPIPLQHSKSAPMTTASSYRHYQNQRHHHQRVGQQHHHHHSYRQNNQMINQSQHRQQQQQLSHGNKNNRYGQHHHHHHHHDEEEEGDVEDVEEEGSNNKQQHHSYRPQLYKPHMNYSTSVLGNHRLSDDDEIIIIPGRGTTVTEVTNSDGSTDGTDSFEIPERFSISKTKSFWERLSTKNNNARLQRVHPSVSGPERILDRNHRFRQTS